MNWHMTAIAAFTYSRSSRLGLRRSVHIHGQTGLRSSRRKSHGRISTHTVGERPPDPSTFESDADYMEECVQKLFHWIENDGKRNILCVTGAGLSTDSGLPDYRGHGGSYHNGHKPMIHDQFMNSASMRQRYWGRAMVGWRKFASAAPNPGHKALAELERMGKIGVDYEDSFEFYDDNNDDWYLSTGSRRLSIITQNVDALHKKAGSRHVTELHGRSDRLVCMNCGSFSSRHDFHDQLELQNEAWMNHLETHNVNGDQKAMRPDGDGDIQLDAYDHIIVPSCQKCGVGILKPHVVFFGDSVPKHRVKRCQSAVEAADGLLCIGSSLAVHSAYRMVHAANSHGIPIAILNVGETRAEVNGLHVTKIDAPAGTILSSIVNHYAKVPPQEKM